MNKVISNTRHNDGLALLQRGLHAQPVLITQAQVLDLPEPVQRYLSYAQVVGKDPIRTVRLKQQGFMRTQPGQKWLPMVAEQYFTTTPPAFLWHGTMRLFPLVSMSGTDRFSDGHGSMLIKLSSLITVGNARGPETDQGELLRYLAETTWFPTAWLSGAIEWQAIDAQAVKVTLQQQNITTSAVLHVNEEGQVTSLMADRYRGAHGQLTPWSGKYNEYQEVEGMRIPTRVEVTWHLATGEFTWFRCKITEIEYNQTGKVTRL